MLPCVLHEDEHLLVVNKPAGWNTHSPSPYAVEGIYDWLRYREVRWANLAIIHRLDKVTSGVLIFAKSQLANRSLTHQFETRKVKKRYEFLTDRRPPKKELVCRTYLARAGNKYVSKSFPKDGELAETSFRVILDSASEQLKISAEPITGRTHQIRVHAAEAGFPILGDELYGGTPAQRVYLHAVEITIAHPETGEATRFHAPTDFQDDPSIQLRGSFIDPDVTDSFRLVHGAGDGWPEWYVDKLGDFLLSQSPGSCQPQQLAQLRKLHTKFYSKAVYHKTLNRFVRRTGMRESSPELLFGESAPDRFLIRENDLLFHASFNEGYSVGLFLDQRDNRRRLLRGQVTPCFPVFASTASEAATAPASVLNLFSYTCGFSVAAAKRECRTYSLDLSKKYLEWGQQNFQLNDLSTTGHEFLFGDTFDWLRRFRKRHQVFDVVLLDPPTFSQSRESGVFRVEQDFARLVESAAQVVAPDGVLFCSTNFANWSPEEFLNAIQIGLNSAKRRVSTRVYFPQPPDFPVAKEEPAYLKTVWLKLE